MHAECCKDQIVSVLLHIIMCNEVDNATTFNNCILSHPVGVPTCTCRCRGHLQKTMQSWCPPQFARKCKTRRKSLKNESHQVEKGIRRKKGLCQAAAQPTILCSWLKKPNVDYF